MQPCRVGFSDHFFGHLTEASRESKHFSNPEATVVRAFFRAFPHGPKHGTLLSPKIFKRDETWDLTSRLAQKWCTTPQQSARLLLTTLLQPRPFGRELWSFWGHEELQHLEFMEVLRVDPVSNGIIFTNGHKVEIGHAHEGGRGAEITMGFGKIKVYITVYRVSKVQPNCLKFQIKVGMKALEFHAVEILRDNRHNFGADFVDLLEAIQVEGIKVWYLREYPWNRLKLLVLGRGSFSFLWSFQILGEMGTFHVKFWWWTILFWTRLGFGWGPQMKSWPARGQLDASA